MKYIIMCGGDYVTWDKPRQLLEVLGEPMVARTIRLLRECGVSDIAISSNNPVFEQFGVPVLKHENDYHTRGYNNSDGYWCDCFYPTNDPACYLFGDVVYSPEAIRTIVDTETDDIMLFGSCYPYAQEYIKSYIEPFGFKVVNQQHLHDACDEVKRLDALGRFNREPIAWEVWNVICNNGDPNTIDHRTYVHINDYTCDIDEPDEIRGLERLVSYIHG